MLAATTNPLGPPTAGWVFEIGGGLVWLALLVWVIRRTLRDRTIPRLGLIFIAASTMFWQEYFCDWGVLLLWNQDFAQWPGWTSTWYQTPNKPIAVFFGYGWFFALGLPFAIWGAKKVQAARPAWNRYVVQGAVSFIFFYAFDIFAEGVMSALHWYRYFSPGGPTITIASTPLSLVHPAILFMLWAVAATLIIANPDDRGQIWHERVVGIDRFTGWKRETVRVAAWCALFNVLLLVTQLLPDVLGRVWFGADHPVVPY